MAKKPKIDTKLLAAITAATAAGGVHYVSQDEAMPLLQHDPALIEVNTNMLHPEDSTKAAARATDAGLAHVASKAPKATDAAEPEFAIISGVELPASKRGNRGGGAPNKYPFDKLEVGQTFFVPVSEKHPSPVKTLGSTVSSANHRYAEETGETKTVQRTKRGAGNKAVKDASGAKIKETVTVPVLRFTRKFTIRAVEKGKSYGAWVAPADGAVIARVA